MNIPTGTLPAIGVGILLLGGCGSGRLASTEVENEVTAARLVATARDTALLVSVPWTLSDSVGILAQGTTDSVGGISAVFPSSTRPLLLEITAPGAARTGKPAARTSRTGIAEATTVRLRAIVIPARHSPPDTLFVGLNLLTDAIARHWSGSPGPGFPAFADSLSRAITGFDLGYGEFALPTARQSREARVVMDVLEQQARTRKGNPSDYLDELVHDDSRSVLNDTSFEQELSDQVGRQKLSDDDETEIVKTLDSLGGQDGHLQQKFLQDRLGADSTLISALFPWSSTHDAGTFRQNILQRATNLGTQVASQARLTGPADPVSEAVRRSALRVYARLLEGLEEVPNDQKTASLEPLLVQADSTLGETFRILDPERWARDDSGFDAFYEPILLSERDGAWKLQNLFNAKDPVAFVASGWPLPHGSSLRQAIENRLATGHWGAAGPWLLP